MAKFYTLCYFPSTENSKKVMVNMSAITTAMETLQLPLPQNEEDQKLTDCAVAFLGDKNDEAIALLKEVDLHIRQEIYHTYWAIRGCPDQLNFGESIEDFTDEKTFEKARAVGRYLKNRDLPDRKEIEKAFCDLSSKARENNIGMHFQVAQQPENTLSNQHGALPYDATRVSLTDEAYINANHLGNAILTQCPIEHTANVFWQMILEKEVKAIVMLNGEGGTDYFPYFPHGPGETQKYQNNTIAFEAETFFEEEQIRMRRLRVNDARDVVHIKAEAWKDRTPGDQKTLVKLVELTRANMGDHPPVIHCMAGIGRTSLFYTMFELSDRNIQDVAGAVYKSVLKQRSPRSGRNPYMMQTFDQYASAIRWLRI